MVGTITTIEHRGTDDMEINSRDKTRTRMNKDLVEYIIDLRENVQKDLDDRRQYIKKLLIADKQRLGVKKATNSPYPGAPNIPLPETDKQIRKKKPVFVQAVVGLKEPVSVDFGMTVTDVNPERKQRLKLAERAFNKILLTKMDLLKTLTIASDQFLSKGSTVFKTIEKFECELVSKIIDLDELPPDMLEAFKGLSKNEKAAVIADQYDLLYDDTDDREIIDEILEQYNSGERIIRYTQMEYSSMPAIIVPEIEDVIVPTYAKEIYNSERIAHRFYLTEREFMTRAIDGAYNIKNVNKAIERGATSSDSDDDKITEREKRYNESIAQSDNDELYEIYEVCCWRPTGKKGRYERWVIAYLPAVADDKESVVQILRFPYELTEWNYDKHDNELKDGRYYSSRGYPEMMRALQEFSERAINNMLIRDEINNCPIHTVLGRSRIAGGMTRLVPGSRLKVNSHDEIQELGNRQAKVDLSSNLIIQMLKAFAEEYLGSTDQLFRNATNAGGGKTLGEIQQGMQLQQQLVSLDLLLWNETLRRVYRKVWKILGTRLGKPIVIDGIPVTRDFFEEDVEITPSGTIENLDKFQMAQKALNRVQLLMQQMQAGIIMTPDDLYNAMTDFLEKDGVQNPDKYITNPQEVMQDAGKQMQQQLGQMQQQTQMIAEQKDKLEKDYYKLQEKFKSEQMKQDAKKEEGTK